MFGNAYTIYGVCHLGAVKYQHAFFAGQCSSPIIILQNQSNTEKHNDKVFVASVFLYLFSSSISA